MATRDEVNSLTASLIRVVGQRLMQMGEFEPTMVVAEGLAVGLIVAASMHYNKQPDELVEAFCEGIKDRVTKMVYGSKQ